MWLSAALVLWATTSQPLSVANAAQSVSVAIAPDAVQPGDTILVTVGAPTGTASVSVSAFDARWPAFRVDDTTWRALVGVDLAQKPGTYALSVALGNPGTVRDHHSLTVSPKAFRRRVLTVPPDFVNPPPSQLARIERDAQFMREVYRQTGPDAAWASGFVRPVADPANSSFGTRSVFNGQPRSPHAGTDFLSPNGTPIHAPASGRIVGARDLFFTGNTVVIDHGLGVFSMLAHLSRLDVREGQAVARGDVVGLVGATGRVTGPHLHWALRVGAARVDPLSALARLASDR